MKDLLAIESLSVEHIRTKRFLLNDITFSLAAGESLVVLGQSGCGKTMTCHAIMGLLDPKRFRINGKLSFNEQSLLNLGRKEKQCLYGGKIVMIPQNPMTAFNPSLRIGKQMMETLKLHLEASSTELENKRKEALIQAGLPEFERVCHCYPHELSGGMLQRVMIAMALMVDAQLIIADEPTTALDVIHRNAAVDSLLSLRAKGLAILLVTHDFSVALQLGGSLLVMNESQIIERGSVKSIFQNPEQPYTRALIEANHLSQQVHCAEL